MSLTEQDFADLKLTEWTSCGGCAAKWGASLLTDLVRDMPAGADPSLLVGLAPFDDAAIYQVAPDVALVSTTDFFPPLVDHPSDFGAIAAANACSDVFAMGGRVVIAVNVAAFPEHFPREAIVAIFDAAAAVVAEAGGTIAGGHTIRNPEPIFGLAVQGVVHPDRVFRKGGARPGDVLVLSKPIGTGAGARRRHARRQGGRHRGHAAAQPGRVRGAAGAGRGGARRHRRHRLRPRRPRLGDGRARRRAGGGRTPTASVAYPGAREAAERGVRTGGDPRNRDYVAAHMSPARPVAGGRGAVHGPADLGWSARRRAPGGGRRSVAEWWRVGEVAAGPAAPRAALMAHGRPRPPDSIEKELWAAGHEIIVGIDEVGRGAWAGPLMVGAAILPREKRVNGVRDSKMLTEANRERLFDRIADWCDAWAVGAASQEECDELGMAAAQRAGRPPCDRGLGVRPDAAVVDGKWNFLAGYVPHVEMRVKADRYCLSVAAASILAKVTRDRLMRDAVEHYPQWSFDTNKGYPCPLHKAALQGYGPSAIHRRTWVFMDHYVPWSGVPAWCKPSSSRRCSDGLF